MVGLTFGRYRTLLRRTGDGKVLFGVEKVTKPQLVFLEAGREPMLVDAAVVLADGDAGAGRTEEWPAPCAVTGMSVAAVGAYRRSPG